MHLQSHLYGTADGIVAVRTDQSGVFSERVVGEWKGTNYEVGCVRVRAKS